MKLSSYLICSVQAAVAAFSINALAGQEATGGVIHFHGQIVESPCDVSNTTHNINVSCLRYGKVRTFHRALNSTSQQEINNELFEKTSLHYLDPERTLAIYTIEYR